MIINIVLILLIVAVSFLLLVVYEMNEALNTLENWEYEQDDAIDYLFGRVFPDECDDCLVSVTTKYPTKKPLTKKK